MRYHAQADIIKTDENILMREVNIISEINVAGIIAKKRREKGLTQGDLARYFGVSKASVSKWETGTSYPDITLLPLLAAYFDMSIDDLIGYEPQMTKEAISKLYARLTKDFTVRNGDEVVAECSAIIKKYYSCYPLLLQMGILYINHVTCMSDEEMKKHLLRQAKELFVRVKTESGNIELAKQATVMEAYCLLAEGEADAVLDLLGDVALEPVMSTEPLLVGAYRMKGQTEKAKSILQVGTYQNIVVLTGLLINLTMIYLDDSARMEETIRRAQALAEAFDLKHLHQAIFLNLQTSIATAYATTGQGEKALCVLEEITSMMEKDLFPLSLHGDEYFYLIDQWIADLDLGAQTPRDSLLVKKDLIDYVLTAPVFAELTAQEKYRNIARRLANMRKE